MNASRRLGAPPLDDDEPTPLCALAPTYAVHALAEAELATFEQHLTECAACRQEVDELREVAAALGTAATLTPPARLREQVLTAIAHIRQQSPE